MEILICSWLLIWLILKWQAMDQFGSNANLGVENLKLTDFNIPYLPYRYYDISTQFPMNKGKCDYSSCVKRRSLFPCRIAILSHIFLSQTVIYSIFYFPVLSYAYPYPIKRLSIKCRSLVFLHIYKVYSLSRGFFFKLMTK